MVTPEVNRRLLRAALAVLAGVILVLGLRAATPAVHWPWQASPPRLTQELIVTQIQDVAKLVSTELTLRDVVTYEQSRFGLERKALLVVTGKVLAGIDLKKDVQVHIDNATRHITIELPRAEILAIDVLNTRTYDETSPLFFGMQPEDRDRIQGQIRSQLRTAGMQSGLLPQADRSARLLLQSMLARDGYTVEVTTRTDLLPAPRSNQ
ncbi:MAG: DUF4230 domain-containing protein [bacterium]